MKDIIRQMVYDGVLKQEDAEKYFPELKEGEEDKIREWCIRLIKATCDYDSPTSRKEVDDALAWLENKGSEPNWCHHKVDLSNCSEEYRKAYYDGWNNCNMQHFQCESEKSDVLKCLINGFKFYYEDNEEATWGTDKWSMPVKHIIEVLEKQGEQKEKQYITITQKILDYIDKHEYSFKNSIPQIGDSWKVIEICKYPSVNDGNPVVKVVNECNGNWMRLPLDIVELNQSEQNPADIIPKDFEKYVEQLLSLSDGEGHGSPAKVREVSLNLLKLAKIGQKPAEWNKEDEKMFKAIWRSLDMECLASNGVTDEEALNWLESFRYKENN